MRKVIPKCSHRKNWYDHDKKIKIGRVATHVPVVLKEQKILVGYVAKTDSIIFHLWPHDAPITDGSILIPLLVHWETYQVNLTEQVSSAL